MKPYYLRYPNIRKDAVFRVRTFIKSNLWKGTAGEKQKKFERLLHDLSQIYKIPQPTLRISNKKKAGNGFYESNHIELPHYSVVTLLHEFRHHHQHQKHRKDTEAIARGWSLSLFYQAAPKHFKNAREKEFLFYV